MQSLLGPSIPEVISWSQNLQCHTVQTASLQYKDIVDCALFSEVSKIRNSEKISSSLYATTNITILTDYILPKVIKDKKIGILVALLFDKLLVSSQ